MGLRSSPTVEMVLEDAVIPASARLGEEGIGFNVAMTALNSGRITIGAIAVGLAQASLDQATSYACIRKQFKKSIIDLKISNQEWIFWDSFEKSSIGFPEGEFCTTLWLTTDS